MARPSRRTGLRTWPLTARPESYPSTAGRRRRRYPPPATPCGVPDPVTPLLSQRESLLAQYAGQPTGHGPGDDRAMTLQRMGLPRYHDNPVGIVGPRDPERVTLSVHHQ